MDTESAPPTWETFESNNRKRSCPTSPGEISNSLSSSDSCDSPDDVAVGKASSDPVEQVASATSTKFEEKPEAMKKEKHSGKTNAKKVPPIVLPTKSVDMETFGAIRKEILREFQNVQSQFFPADNVTDEFMEQTVEDMLTKELLLLEQLPDEMENCESSLACLDKHLDPERFEILQSGLDIPWLNLDFGAKNDGGKRQQVDEILGEVMAEFKKVWIHFGELIWTDEELEKEARQKIEEELFLIQKLSDVPENDVPTLLKVLREQIGDNRFKTLERGLQLHTIDLGSAEEPRKDLKMEKNFPRAAMPTESSDSQGKSKRKKDEDEKKDTSNNGKDSERKKDEDEKKDTSINGKEDEEKNSRRGDETSDEGNDGSEPGNSSVENVAKNEANERSSIFIEMAHLLACTVGIKIDQPPKEVVDNLLILFEEFIQFSKDLLPVINEFVESWTEAGDVDWEKPMALYQLGSKIYKNEHLWYLLSILREEDVNEISKMCMGLIVQFKVAEMVNKKLVFARLFAARRGFWKVSKKCQKVLTSSFPRLAPTLDASHFNIAIIHK